VLCTLGLPSSPQPMRTTQILRYAMEVEPGAMWEISGTPGQRGFGQAPRRVDVLAARILAGAHAGPLGIGRGSLWPGCRWMLPMKYSGC
jgi:hypothetical protein